MTNIDKQLEALLSSNTPSEINSTLDGLEDDYSVTPRPPTEIVPVIFNDEATKVDDVNDYDKLYKFTIENLSGIITRNNAAIEVGLRMAIELESPKALDSVTSLIMSGKESTLALAKIASDHQKNKSKKDEAAANAPTVNNNTQNNYYGFSQIPEAESNSINDMLEGLTDEDETEGDNEPQS